jgi:integral membrane protein
MAHGLLFVLYIVLTIYLKFELNWSFKKFAKIAVASLLPFGTFYSEKKWL